MKKLIIGYIPLSKDLTHPADRRRIIFYAKMRGHKIETNLENKHDVLVVSERANLIPFMREIQTRPLILDLIDGYLSPANKGIDLIRGISKTLLGQFSYNYMPFRTVVEKVCYASDAVVCSTIEQKAVINSYNLNVHPILDSHSEFPDLKPKMISNTDLGQLRYFWEGLPYTLTGFKGVKFRENDFINLLTDDRVKLILGKYVDVDTKKYIDKILNLSLPEHRILPWNIQNVVKYAEISNLAIIPLKVDKQMNKYKAENRLLIMWRLGLPAITAASLAYKRVLEQIGAFGIAESLASLNNVIGNPKEFKDRLNDQVLSGKKYLSEFHEDDKLLEKWDKVIESVI